MSKVEQVYTVDEKADGERLDRYLVMQLKQARNQVQKLIKDRFVTVNEKSPSVHQWLKVGDAVVVRERPKVAPPIPKLQVIAEADDYLVLHKPVGVLVHPAPGSPFPDLTSALVVAYPEIKTVGEDQTRPGIVHRLDRDVSGLLVVARSAAMYDHLKAQFRARTVAKKYTGLVHGQMSEPVGVITFPISRSKTFRGRMAARPNNNEGRDAETRYEVVKQYRNYALVAVELITGRMHQIRVHMKALGHPLVGDTLYGHASEKEKPLLARIFLQSTSLAFNDLSGEQRVFTEPLDNDLNKFLETLS